MAALFRRQVGYVVNETKLASVRFSSGSCDNGTVSCLYILIAYKLLAIVNDV